MSDTCASSSPVDSSGPPSVQSQLPDELLDKIIKAAGSQPFDKKCWLSCSLVCRRWHQLALPYIWRYIRVSGSIDRSGQWYRPALPRIRRFIRLSRPRSAPVRSELTDDTTALLRFFDVRPSIARLVTNLILHRVSVATRSTLHALKVLPVLRCLELIDVQLEGSLSASDYDALGARHTLEMLAYRCDVSPPEGNTLALLELIGLFAEIGRLFIKDGFHDRPYLGALSDAVATSISKLQVGELTIRSYDHPAIAPHSPIIFARDCGLLRNLTCLSVGFIDMLGLHSLSELLHTVGTTLGELCIYLFVDPVAQSSDDYSLQSTTTLDMLRRGLNACVVLHGFRLAVYSDDEYRADSTDDTRIQVWLLAVDVIGCVPVEQVRHLSFCFWSFDHFEEMDLGTFPWFKLRDACRHFNNLQSLKVLFSERNEFLTEIEAECICHELQEFDSMLLRGEPLSFCTCEQESCRWYKY
ncbi:hypothetical protein BC835DRAFT_1531310 [Cytidiella melzeri]|nr:hypothetical protein BC835DRAFT_1531310 [Cytidiella melzeri]